MKTIGDGNRIRKTLQDQCLLPSDSVEGGPDASPKSSIVPPTSDLGSAARPIAGEQHDHILESPIYVHTGNIHNRNHH